MHCVEGTDFSMKNTSSSLVLLGVASLWACSEEVPPPSVDAFMNDAVLLDATMVRCSENRSQTKYEPECVNAREAINRLARAAEAERRAALEAQSERKRRALRRTQEAASAARRRAEEAARAREEAAYLAQFEPVPPSSNDAATPAGSAAPETTPTNPAEPNAVPVETPRAEEGTGTVMPDSAPSEDGKSLEEIREELRRRQDGGT